MNNTVWLVYRNDMKHFNAFESLLKAVTSLGITHSTVATSDKPQMYVISRDIHSNPTEIKYIAADKSEWTIKQIDYHIAFTHL